MLTLNDGRSELWQWDTGRKLTVDADCTQVHFSNKVFGRSIDVDVADGVAIIPDILLQADKDLNVWAFVGTAENGYTKISKTFNVNHRNKPADYVFTPTDQITLQTIQSQIGDLADLTTEAKDTLVAAINEAARTGGGGGGSTVELDTTLTQSGKAADAAAVGDRLSALSEDKVDKTNITLGKHTDGLIYIFVGGKPVGNGLDISSGGGEVVEPVYGQPTTDTAILSLTQNDSAVLGIKLDAEPNVSQTITVLSNSSILTFDKTELVFTASDWNVFQYVTITVGTFEEDATANIILRNSDDLMTDTSIPVYLQTDAYSVDMTIPDGQYTVQASDFTYSISGNWFIPTAYNGTAENIFIPATMDIDGTTYTTIVSVNCFKNNTTIKYVEFADGTRMGSAASYMIKGAFSGCTNLIGLKYRCGEFTDMETLFDSCTSFKWWDGLELNTSATSMKKMFYGCSALEYIPDISGFTSLTTLEQCFWGTSLKKIYGMPTTVGASCNMNSAFYGTQITSGVIPANVTNMNHCFSGCTNLRNVYVYADEVASANGTFTNCSDVVVYAHSGTTTYDTLNTAWGGNSEITIKDFSGETLPLIVTWGDSTTSEGTSWGCWPDRLQEKLGISNFVVRNEAVSGEYTTSTSARQGGNTLKILEGFTIPADATAVTLGSFGTRDGRIFGSNVNNGGSFRPYESFNPCTINGVVGTFTNTNGYQFTRMEAGEAVTVPADTYVYSNQDDALNNSNVIMLIDLGINSGWEEDGTLSNRAAKPIPDDLIRQMQYMIDHFKDKGGTKYIVAGPSAGKFLEQSDEYLSIIINDFEVKAAAQFGENFLNLRKYLVENGLTENGLTPTEEDTARIAKGLVPTSLLHGNNEEDLTHPNEYGANSQMLAFYNKGLSLGYWS